MDLIFDFLKLHVFALYLVWPLLVGILFPILVFGVIVGRIEKWKLINTLYWTIVTATTLGYGDITPKNKLSKLLSLLIVITGFMYTGIFVSVTVSVGTIVLEKRIKNHPAIEMLKDKS